MTYVIKISNSGKKMKQILSITLFMFLVGCVTENQESEKSSSVLSGVFNQQLLKLTLDHEKNSSSITVYNVSYFVDSVGGMDSYPGTSNQPFKTITKALSLVKAGDSIFVAPGTYDAASGERFPLIVPDEVQLIGDELGKGMVGGEQSTGYHGSGSFPRVGPTLISGFPTSTNDVRFNTITGKSLTIIAGFQIKNTYSNPLEGPLKGVAVFLQDAGTTIRNNTISALGINLNIHNLVQGGGGHIITGNKITSAIRGIDGPGSVEGVPSRIENNIISQNLIGVLTNADGLDFGGGSAGSVGNNILSCNSNCDLHIGSNQPGKTLYAMNNKWDHSPPTVSDLQPNVDIINSNYSVTILRTNGYTIATGACQ
ncbi:LIC10774 family surface protein [Leptospira interrogans]|uniref:LIC10774 family surface protein n=1 Tax=Leptospira interrogans TaxID=173 RepID=UPI0002BB11F2|nr:DUF1565 domain-containing protein [Leptospira interrogans]MCH5431599.1 DUF1565 domain-containing protein [Leptospira interrogans serovar Canicola]MCR8626859.1 hypothetical protein [Leptospira interrogans serovar Canicola]OQM29754.1 hypothetical protein DV30_13710 [Leptospira interrogans serovar Canicola str. Gui44]OQM30563.1 hypothetical protein DV38_09710 [Leptospira interrogans]UMQ55155.1 DUF1565 domain-containing protein [Leptospira interrogans]